MAQESFRSEFRRWRRKRPFWGGFFLILAAVELLYSANMSLGNLEVHLGPQGFLSYLLPLLLLLCGALAWFMPAQRIFYGIVALLTALYSFVGLNLGGFFLGMLFGIIGGALVIAWGPPKVKQAPPPASPPTDEDPSSAATPDRETVEIAGHDDRPARDADTAFIPGLGTPAPRPPAGPDPEPPAPPREGLHKNPRALTAALLLVVVTGSLLVAGSGLPASAVDCPEGLPSRSSVASSSAPASAPASSSEPPAGEDAEPTTKPPVGDPTGSQPPADPTSSASTSAGAEDGAGGSEDGSEDGDVLDGIGNLIDGVGNLLGIGDESPSPSTSPTPSAPSAPASPPPSSVAASPSVTSPSTGSSSSQPDSSSSASASGSAAASGSASPSAEEIPCLGPRVMGKVADPDGIPRVALKPGKMEVGSLTMYNSSYDGVVDMPTAKGSFKALKFSMDKAVNKPFTLTIDEPGDAWTIIKSNELVTDGRVRFYTPEMKGKLFGVIPVTFTPDKPPPLTLPVLWFTDVTIQLAFVRCDTLTADPLNISEVVGPLP